MRNQVLDHSSVKASDCKPCGFCICFVCAGGLTAQLHASCHGARAQMLAHARRRWRRVRARATTLRRRRGR
eukprot:8043047-Alexandrium_andersonii.AAC.1